MRWHYRDPLLVWLFPAAYSLHILEEWFGGAPEWLAILGGQPLPRSAFIIFNVSALTAMIVAVRSATRCEARGWMAIAVSTVVLSSGVLHVLGTIATGSYSPGLVTGVILYLPLGQLALLRAWHQARAAFARGVWAGIAVHAIVFAVVLAFVR